jgi:hypothetical protein
LVERVGRVADRARGGRRERSSPKCPGGCRWPPRSPSDTAGRRRHRIRGGATASGR